jgi:tubulin alpha
MVPRAVFVDLDPYVVEEIRGKYDPYYVLGGKEDASCNFARGYCTVGRMMIDVLWDRVCHMMEACDSMQGLFLTHAVAGGTGGGVSSLLSEKLDDHYPRLVKMGIQVIPAPQISSAVVEPYNTMLCQHYMMNQIQTKIMVDNEALYDLSMMRRGIEKPGYADLNEMVAQMVMSMDVSLQEYYTNLVPYPRIHYMTAAYAPMTENIFATPSPYEMTRDVLNLQNRMVKVYGNPGKWISAYVMYRGGITSREVNEALTRYREKKHVLPFVDWSPLGMKCGLRPEDKQRGVGLLVNDTVIKEFIARNNKKFDIMWDKGAFMHWYLQEGLEISEFMEARENMAALEMDYLEIVS